MLCQPLWNEPNDSFHHIENPSLLAAIIGDSSDNNYYNNKKTTMIITKI